MKGLQSQRQAAENQSEMSGSSLKSENVLHLNLDTNYYTNDCFNAQIVRAATKRTENSDLVFLLHSRWE